MLIIGAKGFAKEVLQIFHENQDLNQLAFYDDLTPDIGESLFGKFPVLRTLHEVEQYFKTIDSRFTIGIGKPSLRYKMYQQFIGKGGVFTSTISQKADIGSYEIIIGEGSNILSGVKISNNVEIGTGGLVYYNSIITHDVQIGKFVEISPGATVLGRCKIGDFTQIGSGSIILPDIKIGKNSIIAAGAVITKDVADNVMVAGVPGTVKKDLRNDS